MPNTIVERLLSKLPKDAVLTSPDDCAPYGTDWTNTPGKPRLVVLPRTTEEVAFILKTCHELKVPVVPSGGRTGLAGGAVAHRNELVLSLGRLRRMDPVDIATRKVRVQAGAVTQSVHEHCQSVGLTWPIDLAAKGTSQVGGNLSTNAGGLRVIRYGMARKWVSGLQAVTMAGEIIELNGELEKNNTGYDLVQMLCGSEGTLAVITEATLKLVPVARQAVTFFFSVPDIDSALAVFESARVKAFDILACEFFSAKCLRAVGDQLGRFSPLGQPGNFYLLIDVEQGDVDLDPWLESILEKGLVLDGLLAQSSEEKKAAWCLREGITESVQKIAPLRKYDVCVPLRQMQTFLDLVQEEVVKHPIELYLFGHLGDGSPHLNLLKPQSTDLPTFDKACDTFEKALFQLLKKVGGSVSSEHGIGVLKKHWVEFIRTPVEMRLFREIKRAWDPEGLLNPGKIID